MLIRTIADPHVEVPMPNTNAAAGRVIVLPTGTAVEPETITRIIGIIGRAAAEAAGVKMACSQGR